MADGSITVANKKSGDQIFKTGADTKVRRHRAIPNGLIRDTRLASSSYGSTSPTMPSTPAIRSATGCSMQAVLRPFTHGRPSGTNLVESGGDGIYCKEASLVATTKQLQGNARFDYKITPDIAGYIDATYTKTQNRNHQTFNEFRNVT